MSSTLTQEVDEVTTTTAATASSTVEVSPALPAATSRLARTHRYIARLLLGGIAVQYFFAGLGVFGITSFLPHIILGTSLVIASFALPIIAWRGHLAKTTLRRSWLLAGLMILQGGLIDAGRVIPVVSAFHPVNALLIALVTFTLI
jgi:Family of unknown function (DUF6220)